MSVSGCVSKKERQTESERERERKKERGKIIQKERARDFWTWKGICR